MNTITRRQCMAGLAAAPLALPAQGGRRPNVLLIMTDDQGYGDLSLHGNPHLKTPNMDTVAREGVEFTRFYVSPVCAPTRASLLTGRYSQRCGVWGVTGGRETMRAEETTLAEALRPAGYRTALVGKWHLGEHYPYVPHAQGFDEFVGFRTGHWNSYFDSPLERNGKPFRAKGYISDYFTSEAMRFLEQNRANPFFLYLSYNAPHSPFQVPGRYLKPFESTDLPEDTRSVYAMVSNLDENLGRLLARLDELRLTENTIVVFLTDNGPNGQRYNCGLRASKSSVYEGGVRAPFFIRWPGRLTAGRQVDTIAAHIDVYPTLLEACGVAAPKGLPIDGKSILPLARGDARNWPDRMIFTHAEPARNPSGLFPGAVRTQRYNLVNGNELYDIIADPGEQNNIASKHRQLAGKLRDAYESWYADASKDCFQRYPIPVGYAQENPVTLPVTQSYLQGNLRYYGGAGFAHDWVIGWTSVDDHLYWEIDFVNAARYRVMLRYLCAKSDVGSKVVVSVSDQKLEGVLRDASAKTSADYPAGSRYITPEWASITLGTIMAPKGKAKLIVKSLSKNGTAVMEPKEIVLEKIG